MANSDDPILEAQYWLLNDSRNIRLMLDGLSKFRLYRPRIFPRLETCRVGVAWAYPKTHTAALLIENLAQRFQQIMPESCWSGNIFWRWNPFRLNASLFFLPLNAALEPFYPEVWYFGACEASPYGLETSLNISPEITIAPAVCLDVIAMQKSTEPIVAEGMQEVFDKMAGKLRVHQEYDGTEWTVWLDMPKLSQEYWKEFLEKYYGTFNWLFYGWPPRSGPYFSQTNRNFFKHMRKEGEMPRLFLFRDIPYEADRPYVQGVDTDQGMEYLLTV